MLEIGINVKKTVKHPNLNVLFSSLVTPVISDDWNLNLKFELITSRNLFTCQVRVNSH